MNPTKNDYSYSILVSAGFFTYIVLDFIWNGPL